MELTEKFRESPNHYVLNIEGNDKILSYAIDEYRKKQIAEGNKFVTKETKKTMSKRRINSCKQKRADYMYDNEQLNENEYKQIIQTCNKKREELETIPRYVQDYIDEIENNQVIRTPEEIQKSIDDWEELIGETVDNNDYDDNPFADVDEIEERIDFDDEPHYVSEFKSVKTKKIKTIEQERKEFWESMSE